MTRKLWLSPTTHVVLYIVEHISSVDQFTHQRTAIVRQIGGSGDIGVTLGALIIAGIVVIIAIVVINEDDIEWQVITVIICLSIWRSIVSTIETIFIFICNIYVSLSYSMLVYLVNPRGMVWMEFGMWVILSMMMAKQMLLKHRCHPFPHISAKVCWSSAAIMANACLSVVIVMALMTVETKAMNRSPAPVSDRPIIWIAFFCFTPY